MDKKYSNDVRDYGAVAPSQRDPGKLEICCNSAEALLDAHMHVLNRLNGIAAKLFGAVPEAVGDKIPTGRSENSPYVTRVAVALERMHELTSRINSTISRLEDL